MIAALRIGYARVSADGLDVTVQRKTLAGTSAAGPGG